MPWRRYILAAAVGLGVGFVLFYALAWVVSICVRYAQFSTRWWVAPVVVACVAAAVVAVLVARDSRRRDTETRCRKCGYILRGISEPRCPESGERI